MTSLHVTVAFATLLTSGCSLYQPLISQAPDSTSIAEAGKEGGCLGATLRTSATLRACAIQYEIEKARKQHELTPAIVTSLLVPAAALVTYQAAAGHSSSTTAVIAAGGLAVYGLAGSISPASRVEAYSRGSKAISCALGEYNVTAASARISTVERARFLDALNNATRTLDSWAVDPKNKDNLEPTLTSSRAQIAGIHMDVMRLSATGLIDAQLDRFVRMTVEELNGLLQGTLPTLASLAGQIAALSSNATPGQPPDAKQTRSFNVQTTGLPGTVDKAIQDLAKAADDLLKADQDNRPSLNLASCLISTSTLAAQGLYRPLALGPGNSLSGRTITLEAMGVGIPVTGGQMPYSVAILGEPQDGQPKAEIKMQGGALLTIVPGGDSGKGKQYVVKVYDAIGAEQWVTVTF